MQTKSFQSPRIMGVLNITSDSFFDGGLYLDEKKQYQKIEKLVKDGADILDIGGESTRPNITKYQSKRGDWRAIEHEKEWERVASAIQFMSLEFPKIQISLDTRNAQVARQGLDRGVTFLNIVTADLDDEMLDVLKNYDCDICICHMHGTPATMQNGTFLKGKLITHLEKWFEIQISKLEEVGISKERVIIDPGFGFGKEKPRQDLELMTELSSLKKIGQRVLLGVSRKSSIGEVLGGKSSDELLYGTLAFNAYALGKGVDILRVHDVAAHRDLLDCFVRILAEEAKSF